MLFAYTITSTAPTAGFDGLRACIDELNATMLPPGYGLAPLWGAIAEQGPTAGELRGYEPNIERGHMLALLHTLMQVSRRFPELTISLSGGHGLPPSQLKAGDFEMFSEAYCRALTARTGWQTLGERVLRIS